MIKTFYKKRRIPKVFFRSGLQTRSTAYGDEVAAEYLDWRRYFLERREREGEKFTLFAQGSVERACGSGGAQLPKLALDGVTFEASEDGKLALNGRRVQCDIGSEIKAWAIGTYEEGNFLFVIGKSDGKTRLCAHRLSRGGGVERAESFAELPASLDAKSFLIPLGRHLFFVHNACLGYCYFTPKTCELERTAIGGDDVGSEWCRFVKPLIVADGSGNVFWAKEEDVYCVRPGSPAALRHVVCSKLNTVKDLSCTQNSLTVTLKSKSGSGLSVVRYETDGDSVTKATN